MSHGHDHKDYKRAFGNVEKSSKGLMVLCDGEAPKAGTDVKQQSRTVCLSAPYKACQSCEHAVFTIRLQPGVGNQVVACPRWEDTSSRYAHDPPQYEMVRREQCLDMPYEHCSFCPNKDLRAVPRVKPGWWEAEKWKE
jgi:hypothetical protein